MTDDGVCDSLDCLKRAWEDSGLTIIGQEDCGDVILFRLLSNSCQLELFAIVEPWPSLTKGAYKTSPLIPVDFLQQFLNKKI